MLHTPASLQEQIAQQIENGHRQGVERFMAYFQPYTNTYATLPELRSIYESIRTFPEIRALAIGTRPDCVDSEILKLIQGFCSDYEVWLEYGLQSMHNQTLQRIKRGHSAEDFVHAVELTRQFSGLNICAHVILGLPGEGLKEEQETAQALADLNIEGVKLHPLHVVTGTELDRQYQAQEISLLTQSDYVMRVGYFLERLPSRTVIQRLTADCTDAILEAPRWLSRKSKVIHEIEEWLKAHETWQGRLHFK